MKCLQKATITNKWIEWSLQYTKWHKIVISLYTINKQMEIKIKIIPFIVNQENKILRWKSDKRVSKLVHWKLWNHMTYSNRNLNI